MIDENLLLPDDEIIETGDIQTLSDIIDWGIIDIDIPKLWTKNKGENITVMVCDSGIADHEDLKDNILYDKAISFVNGENYKDNLGHGTSVAGVISAKDSGFGIVGVAPNSKIIPVKVISNRGIGQGVKSLEQALDYALEVRPDIVNLSLGSRSELGDTFKKYLKYLNKFNIPVICAMGNFGEKYACYPAEYPETIGVTSYKKNRNISDFSSRSNDADFALPGEDILTTGLNNQYSIVKGTSFSAPFLSGIVSIILSEAKKKNIQYSVENIKDILQKSCKDYGPEGKDRYYGHGIIDIVKLQNLINNP
jgi:minor extracellular protease Epr